MADTDGFVEMIDEANRFFSELRADNTKAWFEPNKARFVAQVRGPAEFFADVMAEEIGRRTGTSHTGKLFRIHRDVRFSKDKTRYSPHLHILFAPPDRNVLAPAFFFASTPEHLILCLGVVGLEKESLLRWRAFVDRWGDLLDGALADLDGRISNFGDAPLKRVSAPYDRDHPHGDMLRRKGLVVEVDIEGWREDGLVRAAGRAVDRMMPLRRLFAERF